MSSQLDVAIPPQLLPLPRAVDCGTGRQRLTSARVSAEFTGVRSLRLEKAVERFTRALAARSGLPLQEPATQIRISCAELSPRYPGIVEDESYWLAIDDAGIYLEAPTEWGVLRGLVTLLQTVTRPGWVPHVAIEDAPRFPWRGLLLDPARHFLDTSTIERALAGMALCKLNVLHLHLSDDQGFRFPSAAYPKLPSTLCYSRDELEHLVETAADLGIRVIPELDMPGHVTSWLTAYPEWGCRQTAASERFGVHEACLDPTSEVVYKAIGGLLDELTAVFPDPCIHIGGDEVHHRWWSEDPHIRAYMAQHNLTGPRDLQAQFNARVRQLVLDRDRQVIGWDEVLHDDLARDWIVQAWRGATSRDRAAARGNRVLVSAPYYLDLSFPAGMHYDFDPGADQQTLLRLEDEQMADPRLAHVADGLRWTLQWRDDAVAPVERTVLDELVLGGEACLWGELVDAEVLDVRLWSRLPALAERFWSTDRECSGEGLTGRLAWYLAEIHPLGGVDVAQRSRGQLAGLGLDDHWRPLLDMLEPVKWYGRLLGARALAARIQGSEMPKTRPYQTHTPLRGVADYLPPESFLSSRIEAICARAAADALTQTDRDELARLIQTWQRLAAGPGGGGQAGALRPLQEALGELARAMDERLRTGKRIELARMEALSRPQGELMLAIGPQLRAWLMESP
ncbi:MAG: family 20 glycosylhydrolase [Pseudomonadales bacterium]|nr:family 20 glycosylhydrolase [Pseudomonadales bacterium]